MSVLRGGIKTFGKATGKLMGKSKKPKRVFKESRPIGSSETMKDLLTIGGAGLAAAGLYAIGKG